MSLSFKNERRLRVQRSPPASYATERGKRFQSRGARSVETHLRMQVHDIHPRSAPLRGWAPPPPNMHVQRNVCLIEQQFFVPEFDFARRLSFGREVHIGHFRYWGSPHSTQPIPATFGCSASCISPSVVRPAPGVVPSGQFRFHPCVPVSRRRFGA